MCSYLYNVIPGEIMTTLRYIAAIPVPRVSLTSYTLCSCDVQGLFLLKVLIQGLVPVTISSSWS